MEDYVNFELAFIERFGMRPEIFLCINKSD